MTKLIITMICSLKLIVAYSQTNLVLNPSFEDTVHCPFNNNMISYAMNWSGIDTAASALFSNCNPEYFNSSCGIILTSVQPYFHQNARTGSGMVGSIFLSFDSVLLNDNRNYMQGKLSQPLQGGKHYCVKYYVVALDTASHYFNNKQAAYLDDGGIDSVINCSAPIPNLQPQLVNSTIITDTANWVKLEGSFVAIGNETRITIGNFSPYTQTNYIVQNIPSPLEGVSYYGVDDVSVIENNLPAFAGTDALIASGDSVYLGRPNEIGPECRWWANGTALNDSSLGFWAKPTQPTQYVLQQKICGNVKYDTVFVNISGHDGLNDSRRVGDNFKLLPNPSNGTFIISSTQATYNNIIINSIDGKEVYNNKLVFTKGNANFDLDLPNGVYHVKLIGSSGVASQKLVISK